MEGQWKFRWGEGGGGGGGGGGGLKCQNFKRKSMGLNWKFRRGGGATQSILSIIQFP